MLPALIIVFREGFEAFLTVAIILAYLRKTGRDNLRPAVWWGIGASVIASGALGFLLMRVNQPVWEGVFGLIAIVLVSSFVIHLWRTAPKMKQNMENRLSVVSSRASRVLAFTGVFLFTLLMITREGMETALMLIQVRTGRFALGAFLGLGAAALMSWTWAHYGHLINVKRFFQVTGIFLLLFALQIGIYSFHEFSEAGIFPNSDAIHLATEPYSPLGVYGRWFSVVMVGICACWLAGATLADRIRRNRGAARTLGMLLLIALFVTPAVAATITGRVLDSQGSAVGGATVLLQRAETKIAETRTDRAGRFSFEVFESGAYSLRALTSTSGTTTVSQVVEVGTGSVSTDIKLPVVADEITVFGTRIAVAAERIPGAVSVLGRDAIDVANPANLTEVLRKVPGVNVRDEEGFSLRPNIGIRGLNPTRSTKVLLLEDGLPLAYAPYGDNATYYHPPLERFDSIEILKGSGQIAYGPVTVGGVINYLTPPPPNMTETRVKMTGGSRGFFNGHLAWGGTWGKTGVLVNVMRKQGDGARENLHSDLNDVNAKIVYAFSVDQSLTLRANYYGEDSNVTYSGLRESEYAADPRQNPFRNDFFYGDRYGVSLVHRVRLAEDSYVATSLYGSKFKRDWWRQSSNSGQRPNDAGAPNCGGMANLNTTCGNEGRLREYYAWGVEPRLHWNQRLFGFANEFQAGLRAHFEQQDRIQLNGDTSRARTGRVIEDNARDNRAFSAFVQDRLTIGNLTLSPGVRVENINFERLNRLANAGAGARGETSLTQVIPGIGVSYAGRKATIFAGIHRGFAPPRTEDIITNAGGVVDLDPELSWNSEVGVRLEPHAGVQIESTLFRMDYENQVVPASVAGGIGATLTNAGQTLHQGVEIGARFDTAAALGTAHNAYATLAYTFVDEAKFVGRRFSGVPGFTTVSITGNRLPYAPEQVLTAGVGYLLPNGLDAFIEAVHVNEQFGDDLNTVAPTADGQRGVIRAYAIWNATLNYEVRPLKATIFLAVKNVFDELYIADRTRGILPGSPRLIQAGLSFRR